MSTTQAKREVQIVEWITPEVVYFNSQISTEAIAYIKRHLKEMYENGYLTAEQYGEFYDVLIYVRRCWKKMSEAKISKKSKNAIYKWKLMMDTPVEDWTTNTVYYAWWCYFLFDDELVLGKIEEGLRPTHDARDLGQLAVFELIALTHEVFVNKEFIC